jgi:hypothetical protein
MILVKFEWDVCRCGKVEGLFVTTFKRLMNAMGEEVYSGEILGKHSEVSGVLEADDFEIVTQDVDLISLLMNEAPKILMGYNPLEYIREDEEEE